MSASAGSAPSSNSTTGNPFENAYNVILIKFWPRPSPGFNVRLIIQMGLCGYVFVATVLFLVVYTIVIRRQDKKLWMFRFVQTRYGRYIVPNMYIVSVLPSIPAAGLIAGLLVDNRRIFVFRHGQHGAMLWKTLIWVVVYAQGWFVVFSGVTAALLISNEDKPFYLRPAFINTIYIVGPFVVVLGIAIPSILCSNSWNYIMTRVDETLLTLRAASIQYAKNGFSNVVAIDMTDQLEDEILARAEKFFAQYLLMLCVWSAATINLVFVSLVGWSLVFKLRRQRRVGQTFAAPRVPATEQAAAVSAAQTKGSGNGSSTSSTTKNGSSVELEMQSPLPRTSTSPNDQTTRHTNHQNQTIHKPSSPPTTSQAASQGALTKLIRDLFVSSLGVTTFASIFVGDTVMLAVRRREVFANWTRAEIGMTLTTWSYLLGTSMCTTAILINEILFWRALRNAGAGWGGGGDTSFGSGSNSGPYGHGRPLRRGGPLRGSGFGGGGGEDGAGIENGITVEMTKQVHVELPCHYPPSNASSNPPRPWTPLETEVRKHQPRQHPLDRLEAADSEYDDRKYDWSAR
ncbi:BZ3500_MvSof-1268-A1-R1_Chr11-3g03563 [Microbotryum saponariae]|uniref:BZ3500_MvSof-1268-A1-R1_Chr11-3g03563 protein n=1 Tax=Microbotryum saponariae TaxID=289078 RepID=A0A2X0L843_9BASI|nr:BZ3500_MvSof-1268-A1-R1_Chr11-3g03563 [Microbotryum saponariae]SDA03572.1 BZ3501_MvSof-1269-A2-R1_Chr11g03140 [Microbotryum saponariae]